MSIIGLIVVLIIVGAILYLLNAVLPIDARVKTIINVIVIVALCLWLLEVFFGPFGTIVPRGRIGHGAAGCSVAQVGG